MSRQRRRRILFWVGATIVAVGLAWIGVVKFGPRAARERDRVALAARLQSSNPEVRKKAAWDSMRLGDPALELSLARHLTSGEPDDGVREAIAYSLGHATSGAAPPALSMAVDLDDSGFVRAAAWLALARTDEKRFTAAAELHADRDDLWDRLGIAQGRLWLGDTLGTATVFEAALKGDSLQHWVATRAIQRSIRPLLDAVGRWPLEQAADEWPPGSVERIQSACERVNLAALSKDCRAPLAAAQDVRQYVRKLASASDRIGRWLVSNSSQPQQESP